MEKPSKRSRNTSKSPNNKPMELAPSSSKDEATGEFQQQQARQDDVNQRTSNVDGAAKEELSDEDEVVNYPNLPPIQNGFVVFIHQFNLVNTAKEKRTVVEWISDALNTLDIHPELITVDDLVEESIVACSKPKPPIIKFSRPVGNKRNNGKVVDPSAPSFRLRSKHQSGYPESLTAKHSKAFNSREDVKPTTSKKKSKWDRANKGSAVGPNNVPAGSGTGGGTAAAAAGRGGSRCYNKSLNSSSSKSLQRKSCRNAKLQQNEEKKLEYGVQLSVLKDKVRNFQNDNKYGVWVLLIESSRLCIVDMGKLNNLASKFRFKVRWIAAQAPRSLDQSVFSVVNDIVQTKNICFPDQMKETIPLRTNNNVSNKSSKSTRNSKRRSDVEILYKTMSSKFDVASYASFDIGAVSKVASELDALGEQPPIVQQGTPTVTLLQQPTPGPDEITIITPGTEEDNADPEEMKTETDPPQRDEDVEDRNDDLSPSQDPGVKSPNTSTATTTNKRCKKQRKAAETTEQSITEVHANSLEPHGSSSLFEIRSGNKNYKAVYNTAVQMALISTNNPFASPYVRTDLPGFHGLPMPNDHMKSKKEVQVTTTTDVNGNEVNEVMMTPGPPGGCMLVVVRDLTKSGSCGLALLLKKMLRREGIKSYTISVTDLLSQPQAFELMESLALSGGYNPERDGTIGCKLLIQRGLDTKLGESKHQVVIVDVGDEVHVRMWSVYNYGIKLGQKCMVLEKRADGTFECNLKKVFQTIRRRFKSCQLYTWPSFRHSAMVCASSNDLLNHESLEGLGRVFIRSTSSSVCPGAALKTCKSGTFKGPLSPSASTPNVWRRKADSDLEAEPGRATRQVKSLSCTDSIKDDKDKIYSRIMKLVSEKKKQQMSHPTAAELPDVLGGTGTVAHENADSEVLTGEEDEEEDDETTGSESGLVIQPIFDEQLIDVDFILPETEESRPQMNNNNNDGSDDAASRITDKSQSTDDDSSEDSKFLNALKASMMQVMPNTIQPEFSEESPNDREEEDHTDISGCQRSTTKLLQRRSMQLKALLQDETSTDEESSNNLHYAEMLTNKLSSSSRSSIKNRMNLLEIHRCQSMDEHGGTQCSVTDEDLFKGWIAVPGLGRTRSSGFFKRTRRRITGMLHSICSCNRKTK